MPQQTATTVKELRSWSQADLQAKLETLRRELWQRRVEAGTGALQQTHQLGDMRRQIARVLTVLRAQHAQDAGTRKPKAGTTT